MVIRKHIYITRSSRNDVCLASPITMGSSHVDNLDSKDSPRTQNDIYKISHMENTYLNSVDTISSDVTVIIGVNQISTDLVLIESSYCY